MTVSWVNYFNLNKARILAFKKPIHIQYIMGMGNTHIIFQNILESVISVLLAFALTILLFDFTGQIINKSLGFLLFSNGFPELFSIWPFIIIILAASVFAGSLPAINYILNNQKTLSSLQNINYRYGSGITSNSILMTLQFGFSIILMVATTVIYQQKSYILSHNLGKKTSGILVFKRQNWEIREKYNSLRIRALQNPLIKNFTASMEEPSGETMDAFNVESSAIREDLKDRSIYVLPVEDDFLTFFDIKLIAGRNFSPYNPARKGEDYILNESAVKELNWTPEEAIGKPFKLKFSEPDIFYGGTVVGVVHDFNFTNLKQNIKPYVLFQKPIFYLCFIVQIDSAKKQQAIQDLKKIWEQELPDYPFQYEFLSDVYHTSYKREFSQSRLMAIFSFLAILIICSGLFSVTSVLIARRTKEIGIRKVNGARIWDILVMLNSGFLVCFAVAFVFACPVAMYAMNKWLQGFAYRTEIKWWVFIIAGITILSVIIFTVTFQSRRTATRNPVEALRYE